MLMNAERIRTVVLTSQAASTHREVTGVLVGQAITWRQTSEHVQVGGYYKQQTDRQTKCAKYTKLEKF